MNIIESISIRHNDYGDDEVQFALLSSYWDNDGLRTTLSVVIDMKSFTLTTRSMQKLFPCCFIWSDAMSWLIRSSDRRRSHIRCKTISINKYILLRNCSYFLLSYRLYPNIIAITSFETLLHLQTQFKLIRIQLLYNYKGNNTIKKT